MFNCPPGPKIIKMSWVVNFQKAGMAFYILLLMFYY